MATPHSTRHKAKANRSKPLDRRQNANHLRMGRHGAPLPRSAGHQSKRSKSSPSSAHLISQLREVSLLLSVIYSTCVTAELALKGQSADHDRDILAMLRTHVSEPVSRQVERLDSLVVELGRAERAVRP
jgi:hypothetical protein